MKVGNEKEELEHGPRRRNKLRWKRREMRKE
jgi:hypothetical protein